VIVPVVERHEQALVSRACFGDDSQEKHWGSVPVLTLQLQCKPSEKNFQFFLPFLISDAV
jgi:hypothetical protein